MSAPPSHVQPQVQWVAPSPLWPGAAALAGDAAKMRVPALLRFTSDHFIDELKQAVAAEPAVLSTASWESARLPPAGVKSPATWKPTRPANAPLKLFQPVHGRFYMVAASLVCQQVGLPDHALRIAQQERAYFVIRRIQKDAQGTAQELAWVQDPSAPGDKAKRVWQAVPSAARRAQLAKDEELLPLFPVFIPKTATRPARRIHAGLIPTSSRETLASSATIPGSAKVDSRSVAEAEQRVVDTYQAIVDASAHVVENGGGTVNPRPALAQLEAEPVASDPAIAELLQASVFLALDLADVLDKYVPDVFSAIVVGGALPPAGSPARTLHDTLVGASFDPRSSATWADAIRAAWGAKDAINDPKVTSPAVPTLNLVYALSSAAAVDPGTLGTELASAINAGGAAPALSDATATAMVVPKFDGRATYVVRCVFQRCTARGPELALLYPPVVSDPSEAFEIASFFDTDAPARTIRIPLPIDTSPAGLRKFPKSVGFLMSDQLQQQLCKATDMASLLKGQIGSCSSLQLGQICSFSIPIITIIALFLMILMAIVLNIIFWWLPFLKICLPIPISAPSEPEEA